MESVEAETIPHEFSFAFGRIERVILNDTDPFDEGVAAVSNAILSAAHEVCAQLDIIDPQSEVGQKFLGVLSKAQSRNPQLKVFLAVNTILGQAEKLEREISRLSIKAHLSVHPPLPTRGSLHSKAVIIDGLRAFIGGDNIDNPTESDLTVVVRGSVVDSMLLEFDDLFRQGDIRSIGQSYSPVELLLSHANNSPNVYPVQSEYIIQLLGKGANRSL
ncbi:MAG: PLD-like domain, partial [Pseudomonadota bacterium]